MGFEKAKLPLFDLAIRLEGHLAAAQNQVFFPPKLSSHL